MTCKWLAHDLLDLFCDNYDKKVKSLQQQQYNTTTKPGLRDDE